MNYREWKRARRREWMKRAAWFIGPPLAGFAAAILAALAAGCGGVSRDELAACRESSRRIAAAEGCEFRWSACSEADAGGVECAFGMDCAGVAKTATNHCLSVRR